MAKEFTSLGGQIHFEKQLRLINFGNEIIESSNTYHAKHFINAAGSHADEISRSIGVGIDYAMVPFMGLYRYTSEANLPIRHLVYPVPHPINPFLGVHFTITNDQKVKIGPTAIPIFGREQYSMIEGWSFADIAQALKGVSSLIRGDAHDFSALVRSEWTKALKYKLIQDSAKLVPSAKFVRDWKRKPPGIRAQLVHLPTGKLVQDYIVERTLNSTHVLNAVSPGWTSSLPFGRWVADAITF